MGSLGWTLHLFTRDFLASWSFEVKAELPTTNSENGYLGIQEKEWSWSLEKRLPCCRWTTSITHKYRRRISRSRSFSCNRRQIWRWFCVVRDQHRRIMARQASS